MATKLKTVEDEIHARDEEAIALAARETNLRIWNRLGKTDPKHTKASPVPAASRERQSSRSGSRSA
jgi:hypothetical protein